MRRCLTSPRTQRGFIAMPAMAWAAIAAGVVIAGMGAALWAQTVRLESCEANAAKLEAQITVLGSQLDEQNRAVEALQAAGVAKQATAAKALAKANAKARTWDAQATRLQAALTARKPTDATDCKAAWQELRK